MDPTDDEGAAEDQMDENFPVVTVGAQFDSWDARRDIWAMFARSGRVNFGDRTTNSIESFHQKSKSEVPRMGSLDIMFDNVKLVLATLENTITHRLFKKVMRREPTNENELQQFLTPYAFKQVQEQVHQGSTYQCEELIGEDRVKVWKDNNQMDDVANDRPLRYDERVVEAGIKCNCSTFSSRLLPCRHIFAARKHCGLDLFPKDLFHQRWLQEFNPVVMRCEADISQDSGIPSVVCSQTQPSPVLGRSAKYHLIKPILDRLCSRLVSHGSQSFQSYMDALNVFEEAVAQNRSVCVVTNVDTAEQTGLA
jgi:hypothetical protein